MALTEGNGIFKNTHWFGALDLTWNCWDWDSGHHGLKDLRDYPRMGHFWRSTSVGSLSGTCSKSPQKLKGISCPSTRMFWSPLWHLALSFTSKPYFLIWVTDKMLYLLLGK